MFAGALRPLADAGKLGAILYQFPQWFAASRDNVAYLRELAERSPAQPAIEFRGAGWMKEGKQERTLDTAARHRRDVRGGGRAAGLQDVGAAGRGGDLAGPGDDPLPRPQRGELGEARHQRGRALQVPVRRGRAAQVGRARARAGRRVKAAPRADEQLLRGLRRAQRRRSSRSCSTRRTRGRTRPGTARVRLSAGRSRSRCRGPASSTRMPWISQVVRWPSRMKPGDEGVERRRAARAARSFRRARRRRTIQRQRHREVLTRGGLGRAGGRVGRLVGAPHLQHDGDDLRGPVVGQVVRASHVGELRVDPHVSLVAGEAARRGGRVARDGGERHGADRIRRLAVRVGRAEGEQLGKPVRRRA